MLSSYEAPSRREAMQHSAADVAAQLCCMHLLHAAASATCTCSVSHTIKKLIATTIADAMCDACTALCCSRPVTQPAAPQGAG
jgi:hypothetical protein